MTNGKSFDFALLIIEIFEFGLKNFLNNYIGELAVGR